jgi:hypothetical protein
VLLSYGKPDEVREFCTRVIREVAPNGGYIMDAGAIMQDDTSVENMKVMTQTCRELGGYPIGSYAPPLATPPCDVPASVLDRKAVAGMAGRAVPQPKPGICLPWEEKLKELPEITGDRDMVRQVWENLEGLANTYIWQMLLSF